MRGLLVAAVLTLGCSDPSYENGNLRCAATSMACPAGFHCAADQTCWHDGQDPDLGAGDLAGSDFAAPADLTLGEFDLTADDSGCATVNPGSCCGVIVNDCNQTITCTGDCTAAGNICGGGGFPNLCGCSTDLRTGVYRLVAADNQKHCYTTQAAPGLPPSECLGYTIEGTSPKFFVYAGDPPPGMSALMRCLVDSFYYLTFDAGCDGVNGATLDGVIGYVAPGPLCGAVALHRYDGGAAVGMFYTTNPGEAPVGATEITPPFYVWTN